MPAFDDIQIGDPLGPTDLLVSRPRLQEFIRLSGIEGAWRFSDPDRARAEGLPGIIIPGNLSACLITKFITDWGTARGAYLMRLGTTYRSPLVPEQHFSLQGFVTHTDDAARRVELDIWIENEEAERMVIATATLQFP